MLIGERTNTSDTISTDARENEADYIITTDSPNDVNDVAQSQYERMKNDVSNRNKASEAENNENSSWPGSVVYHKNQEKSLPYLSKKTMPLFWKIILLMITMHKTFQKTGMILWCPKYLKAMIEMKIRVLEEENTTSGLILVQTTQKTSDNKGKIKLRLKRNADLSSAFSLQFL